MVFPSRRRVVTHGWRGVVYEPRGRRDGIGKAGLLLLSLLFVLVALGCPKKGPVGLNGQAAPAPAEPPAKARAQEDVRPPEPLPAEDGQAEQAPRLLSDPVGDASGNVVEGTLARAERFLGMLAARSLTGPQIEERDAGAAFVGQARGALRSGESDRATILAEKALVLAEELERATRP